MRHHDWCEMMVIGVNEVAARGAKKLLSLLETVVRVSACPRARLDPGRSVRRQLHRRGVGRRCAVRNGEHEPWTRGRTRTRIQSLSGLGAWNTSLDE